MEFNNVEQAKKAIFEGHQLCEKAIKVGDVKTNNKIIRTQINPAYEYLENNDKIGSLIDFLNHDDDSLKLSIAIKLLPYYSEISVNVIENIIALNSELSWKAKIVLREFKKNK